MDKQTDFYLADGRCVYVNPETGEPMLGHLQATGQGSWVEPRNHYSTDANGDTVVTGDHPGEGWEQEIIIGWLG